MVCWLLAAVLTAGTGMIHDLGIVVNDEGGALEVIRVLPGGRGEKAGIKKGQFILSVAGVEMSSLYELRVTLRARRGDALDVEVADQPPQRGGLWAGLSATGNGITGQDNTVSSFTGVLLSLDLLPHIRGIAGLGYSAIGEKPFSGRDAWTPLLGLHFELSLIETWLVPFARLVCGPNLTWHHSNRLLLGEFGSTFEYWNQEPVTLALNLGARIWWIEASLSMGIGPAEKLNVGMNVTIWFPLRSVF